MGLHDDIKYLIGIGIIIAVLLAILVSWFVMEAIWDKIFN